jgi:hypothetical protein
MQANAMLLNLSATVANMLGILAVLLVLAVLTDTWVPLITSDRAAFFTLAIIGFTMCAVGGVGTTQAVRYFRQMWVIKQMMWLAAAGER